MNKYANVDNKSWDDNNNSIGPKANERSLCRSPPSRFWENKQFHSVYCKNYPVLAYGRKMPFGQHEFFSSDWLKKYF